ncbi:MAG: acyltransferase [Prevotella sp.]|jgi:peptidoglycan/LPS O-acetylase OafA/YrhL|nr:acyltransferase [Prevotella sp.]
MKGVLLKTDISNRILGLDILRCAAIMSVLVAHSLNIAPNWIKSSLAGIMCHDGVTMFFVLSGFLIGNILIKSFNNKEVTVRTLTKFWINRWFRTLPPYFFILAVLIFTAYVLKISPYGHGILPAKKDVLHYFFFLQNFNWPNIPFFAESWSLAVEEWFYLLTPVVATHKIARLNIKHTFLVTIILFSLFSIAVRCIKFFNSAELDAVYYYDSDFRKQVITRFDSMMIGVFAAYIAYYFKKFWENKKYYFFVAGLILFLLPKMAGLTGINNIKPYFYFYILSFSIESFAYFCFLPLLHSIKTVSGLSSKTNFNKMRIGSYIKWVGGKHLYYSDIHKYDFIFAISPAFFINRIYDY